MPTDLERRVLLALLDGWVSLDELARWADRDGAGGHEPAQLAARSLVDAGLAVRGSIADGGFLPVPSGAWLRRTRGGEEAAHALEHEHPRGPPPRKKTGRCG